MAVKVQKGIFTCQNCGMEHEIIMKKKKSNMAIVIGHYEAAKGAKSNTLGKYEWDFYRQFESKLEEKYDVFYHPNISSYTARQRATSDLTDSYDIVCELHFNSSGNTEVSGAEVLMYHGAWLHQEPAEKFLERYCQLTTIKNRGVKLVHEGENGYGFLVETRGRAFLLEPFFGSNKNDCEDFSIEALISGLEALETSYNESQEF